ncbi:MAG TPA: hypothetical protein ENO23_07235 [Alphaproteobacteria bacterium]|nr:hypothetical protein [Alphaproteobacteria bacterium]
MLPFLLATIALASPAAADLGHSGNQTPVGSGWVELGDPSVPYVGRSGRFVQGVPGWGVFDGSTAVGSALYYSAEQFPVAGAPWTFSARLGTEQVVTGNGALTIYPIGMGVFFEVTTDDHRRFLVQFGREGPGALLPDFTWVHLAPSASSTPTLANAWPTTPNDRLVLVELASDGTTADLFVNGVLIESGYPGFVQASVPGRVLWGAGSSADRGGSVWANVGYVTGTQACSNGIDDDGNGLVDALDPYCESPLDPREGPPPVPCTDGVDTDADGICDVAEPEVGTNTEVADTDGDGLNDGDELLAGTDPLDDLSPPPMVPIGGGWALATALGLTGTWLSRRRRGEPSSRI